MHILRLLHILIGSQFVELKGNPGSKKQGNLLPND